LVSASPRACGFTRDSIVDSNYGMHDFVAETITVLAPDRPTDSRHLLRDETATQ